MQWLLVVVIIVMLAGLVSTWMIGQSKSNQRTDSRYTQNTGKKWIRLSGIYVAGMIVVAIIVVFMND